MIALLISLGSIALSEAGLSRPAQSTIQSWLSPLQTGLSQLGQPLSGLIAGLRGGPTSTRQVDDLEDEIQRLKGEIIRLREAEQENQRLRNLLNFTQEHSEFQYLGARVVGTDPTGLIQAVVIDRGAKDGIKEGMVAVAPGGLVGRITQVFEGSARLLLIIDPRSAVAAVGQRSRSQGVVRGSPDRGLAWDYIPQGEDIKEGDLVVTSGLGGTFPKGLLIGQVRLVRRQDVALFQEVRLEPAANLQGLDTVLIITNFLPKPILAP